MSTLLPLEPSDPRTAGSCKLTGRLSAGASASASGSTFLAATPDGRPVVVKTAPVAPLDPAGELEFRARLRHEARAAQRIPPYSVAAVLDVDAEARPPFVVSEYIVGPTLAEAVREHGPMPIAELWELAATVAGALAATYAAAGIVHGGLDPDSVVLSPAGPRVVGVGVARPEPGRRPADDVFAWGAVVLFAATGRVLTAAAAPPDLTGLPPSLLPLVAGALHPDPALRPRAPQLASTLTLGPPPEPRPEPQPAPVPTPVPTIPPNPWTNPLGGPADATVVAPGSQVGGQPVNPWGQIYRPAPSPGGSPGSWWHGPRVMLPVVLAVVLAVAVVATVAVVLTRGVSTDGETGAIPTPTVTSGGTASAGPAPTPGRPSDFVQPTPLGDPLTGHSDSVYWVVFSPDASILATSSLDQTVVLWDVTDPADPFQLGQPLVGHTDLVNSVAFSPDGSVLATGGGDATIILWDISDPTAPRQLNALSTAHTDSVTWVSFSPDGTTLTSASLDQSVILWDVTDPAAPRQLSQLTGGHTDAVWSAETSPDGTTLATGNSDGTVVLWDVTDPTSPARLGEPLTGHSDTVWAATFSPDGDVLASASSDGTTILWDVTDPAAPTPLGDPLDVLGGEVFGAAFSPDGDVLATANADATVVLWDVTDPAAARPLGIPLAGHSSEVLWVAFSPDGETLASAGSDSTVILWDLDG